LQVTSPRGARVVMLLLPEERVVSVAINGREIPRARGCRSSDRVGANPEAASAAIPA